MQTFISLVLHFPFKWPREEKKNKTIFTATRSQKTSPKNRRQLLKENLFGALSQGLCADWLVCIAFCITGIWLAQTSCPIFLKLGSLPVCKGKSYLKLSKLILNWTVGKNYGLIAFADNMGLTNSYMTRCEIRSEINSTGKWSGQRAELFKLVLKPRNLAEV